jgi:hypothetical protein
MSSVSKLDPFKGIFCCGNEENLHGVKSGEYGSTMDAPTRVFVI